MTLSIRAAVLTRPGESLITQRIRLEGNNPGYDLKASWAIRSVIVFGDPT
jgi:hypothetical protein